MSVRSMISRITKGRLQLHDTANSRRQCRRLLVLGAFIATAFPDGRLFAAKLSIPTEVSHSAASVVTVSVEYSGKGDIVAALQFDLQYDPSVLDISATAGSATLDADKALSTNVLPDGSIRFLIAGFNQNVIADGSVVELSIHVSADVSNGPHNLTIVNALGASPSSTAISIKTRSGRIIVTGGKSD